MEIASRTISATARELKSLPAVPATRETSRTISATAREFTPGPKSKAISNHFQELMNIQMVQAFYNLLLYRKEK